MDISDVNRLPKIWYQYQENTNTKSVFGTYISVPNLLVFWGYFIGILSTIFLKKWFNIGIFFLAE